jgi:hypothetical protein
LTKPQEKSDDSLTTRERPDFANPVTIAVGFIPILILLCCVPVFWIFLPFVIVALVILFFMSETGLKKAKILAQKHLNGSQTKLYAEFSLGLTSAVVLNDWGIVYIRSGAQPVELPWESISFVEEPSIAKLAFYEGKSERFNIDLSEGKYFLATKSIYSKIPQKTKFVFNPETGSSNLKLEIAKEPYEWHGKWGYIASDKNGIRQKKKGKETYISWDDLHAVEEIEFSGEDQLTSWELNFKSGDKKMVIASKDFSEEIHKGQYDFIKMIVELQVPTKRRFVAPALTAQKRAEDEFNRIYESMKAAYSFAVKSGKWDHIENNYKHCLWLLDKFSLQNWVPAEQFLKDYAELLNRTNRGDDGAKLLARSERRF